MRANEVAASIIRSSYVTKASMSSPSERAVARWIAPSVRIGEASSRTPRDRQGEDTRAFILTWLLGEAPPQGLTGLVPRAAADALSICRKGT
jgi:hypothetical protein